MFRFWSSDAKGDKLIGADETMAMLSKDLPSLATSPRSLKRKASMVHEGSEDDGFGSAKRAKLDYSVATPPETPAMPRQEYFASPSPQTNPSTDRIVNIINEQFGTEILLKHQELRFINQELAKCQVALEQLRRCHLIPYPTSCPTPQQMLDIAQGKGPAAQSRHGEAAPQWAPPFGVVDGPYARHYAKWLIPDPKFDGMLPEWQVIPNVPRNAAEGRTTRNSLTDASTIGKRVGRGQTAQKLSASYPAPKPKAPCIVKKSDGITVKLVCNFCHREDFSSTQGFINHCRIAHKKEYKSHEEAAVDCGRPISVTESGGIGGEEKPSSTPASGIVHPLARPDATAEQNAYATLLGRIDDSLRMLHRGNLPGVCRIPAVASPNVSAEVARKPSKSFAGASATPFLSQLLQKRDFKGDLSEHVEDATTKMDLDGIVSGDEDYEEGEQSTASNANEAGQNKIPTAGARIPATVMRVPARAVPPPQATGTRPSSSKGRSPHLSFASTGSNLTDADSPTNGEYENLGVDDNNLMEVDQSPTTATSINAPSLVSDDGGDDESDDGSSSDASDDTSMADVTEVNIEYPEVQDLSQHGSSANTGARMKKDETRHVTFVTPITGKAAARRKPNV
ncbi:Protein AHC1 [Cytospora mali]|uniref:Protein AHC1 n=1 Tax=Cytospora mali TaxID=578113 RepID=A0A194UV05_CYTMA|nr:Protein AHC1 [Valsa mali var. pyri (nom. inval.)]